jgi:hypothetical protein
MTATVAYSPAVFAGTCLGTLPLRLKINNRGVVELARAKFRGGDDCDGISGGREHRRSTARNPRSIGCRRCREARWQPHTDM